MRITVKVKPRSKRNEVQHLGDQLYHVMVTAPPIDGKANDRVIELLSEYFGVPKRNIKILSGMKSRMKKVEISSP